MLFSFFTKRKDELKQNNYFRSMVQQIHPNKIRQILLLSVIVLLAILIGREMYFLLGAFLGAVTFYVILRNAMIKLVSDYKWKKSLAALALILVSLMVLVLPVGWLASVAFDKIQPLLHQPELLNEAFEKIHQYLIKEFNIDIFNEKNMAKVNGYVVSFAQQTLGSTMAGLGNLVIMYFILFFMLVQTMDVEYWLRKNVPFKNSNVNRVITEFRNLVYSNALGIPVVAMIQGLVGLIGYWIFGVEEFVLMGILTAIVSVMPVVGSMAVYVPLMIYQLSIGHTWQGVAIGLWGFLLIGSVDNVARFMLQKRMSNVHPLITIFGVLIGLNIFGFLGLIFGPLLLSMFILLVKVYIDEFGQFNPDAPMPSNPKNS
jgi:predicted PurR-regulated permease PerM